MNLEINLKRKREDNTIPLATQNKTGINDMKMNQPLIETIKTKPKSNKRKLSEEGNNKNKAQRLEENISNKEEQQRREVGREGRQTC